MLKQFIEWLEGDASRGRKVALMSTIFVFLVLTISTFIVAYCGVPIQENLVTIYITLSGLMGTIFGFYASTKASTDASTEPDKIDETVAKIIGKMKDLEKKL